MKRFTIGWAVFSCLYAGSVLYRALVLRADPGLSVLAAFIAITAVWLDVWQLRDGSRRLRIAVLGAVLLTIITNAAIMVAGLLAGRSPAITRVIFTALFIFILHDRVCDIVASRQSH